MSSLLSAFSSVSPPGCGLIESELDAFLCVRFLVVFGLGFGEPRRACRKRQPQSAQEPSWTLTLRWPGERRGHMAWAPARGPMPPEDQNRSPVLRRDAYIKNGRARLADGSSHRRAVSTHVRLLVAQFVRVPCWLRTLIAPGVVRASPVVP